MWFKRNICKVFIIREGGFLCRIVSPVSAEASSLALCRTPETMAVCKPREEASLRCGFPWIRAHTEAQPRSGLHCSDDAFVADMEPSSGFTPWGRSFPRVDSSLSLLTLPAVSTNETPSAFLICLLIDTFNNSVKLEHPCRKQIV